MTTFGADNIRCAHCGEVSEHMVLGSSNTFLGSPDLDLRPAEMYRSTMSMWVQRCPTCDYCAPDISKIHRKVRKHIDSDELKAALSDTAVPELARRFAACAVLEQKAGRLYEAASGFHCAAWACDDESEDQLAMEFRRKTIELLTEMRQRRIPFDRAGQYEAVLTDLLRRVGEFDSAGAECQAGVALVSDNSVPLEIFELQRELIAAGDTAAHSVPEIPPTPEELEAQQRAAEEYRLREQEKVDKAVAEAHGVRALYARILSEGAHCTHCNEWGDSEEQFRFSKGKQPCVICRKCGWPQEIEEST
jgi:hypothetical protein